VAASGPGLSVRAGLSCGGALRRLNGVDRHKWDETARGTVAALVIYESAIFSDSASAWQAQEARYAAESRGLTPRSMTALGWRIVE